MNRTIVVGGGVVGLCTAWALRRRGAEVTLLDAGPPERASSHANAGWLVPSLAGPVPAPGLVGTSLRWMLRTDSPLYLKPRADGDFLRWLLAFWRHCNVRDYQHGTLAIAALGRETMSLFDAMRADGVTFEEHRDGIVFAYQSRRELEQDYAGLDLLRPFGHETPPLLDGDAMRDLEPVLNASITGGFWFSRERHVRPDSLVAGLVAHLRERGVDMRPRTGVLGIEHRQGRVVAVATTEGRIAAEHVVVCAGAWTPTVLRLAGARVPIEAGKGYSLDYTPPPELPYPVRHPLSLHEARVAVTPLDGCLRLAGTMELSGLNYRLEPSRLAAIAQAGATYLQGWPADPPRPRVWTGARPMTPDGLPVIGLVAGFSNLAVASGHAMLGVTLAPVTGEAIAELLTLGIRPEGLAPFDPSRFGRG